jgi:hypothetical protein
VRFPYINGDKDSNDERDDKQCRESRIADHEVGGECADIERDSKSANWETVTPNATSGTGGAGGGVSSTASCLGAIPSTAGNAGAGDLLGGGC